MIGSGPQTNPILKFGTCLELSISMTECSQVPGRHCEIGNVLDQRAGQCAHHTHIWSIYHDPLVRLYYAGSTAQPFIHSAALTVFDHTNVGGTLLSSLGSSSTNSSGLRGP
ncbi:hypothetical protein CRENBAI_011378, partial [Crenichthys baileyi]